MKPNKLHIPVNNLEFTKEGAEEFNELYRYCLEMEQSGEFERFMPTRSCGISIQREFIRGPRWLVTVKTTFVELLIKNLDGRYYRFIIGAGKVAEKGFSGRRAWQIFCSWCNKFNIDIEKFAIEGGWEVKQTIPAPRISLEVPEERTYTNAHHIDLNSSYASGIIEAFPELSPVFTAIYETRKQNDGQGKKVLTHTPGYMQSELCNYRFSHITKSAFDYTLRELDILTQELTESGRRILAYNTDGIWYQGEPYHNEKEGKLLGQWKHDYTDCTVRFKSKGAYEIKWTDDTGEHYKPVVRGSTTLDRVKPREEWTWGDIFQGDLIKFKFIEGIGVYSEC